MSGDDYTGYRGCAWYREPKAEVACAVLGVFLDVWEKDTTRLAGYELYLKLYGSTRAATCGPQQSMKSAPSPSTNVALTGDQIGLILSGGKSPLRLNLAKSAVNTITARVGQIKPRPTFVTNKANWSLQRKAKQLQLFVDGAYHQADVYDAAAPAFRDAMVLGTAALMPYAVGIGSKRPKLRLERSPAWEWFVEPADGENGEPRCLYRARWVSREKVRLTLPAYENAGRGKDNASDEYCRVVEAWFRPVWADADSKDVAKCGRHVLCVEDQCAVDEPYPYEDFPVVFFHWDTPVNGFWCDAPAVKEVLGIQIEINKLLAKVQRSMTRVGQPIGFVPSSANLKPKSITNEEAVLYEYDGAVPPTFVAHQPISPQILTHVWDLWAKGFEILGSNELQAAAAAPKGMESARGLERLSEQGVVRFKAISAAWETALGEQLTRRFLRLAKVLDAATPGGFKLQAGKHNTVSVKWRDVEMDEDSYLLQQFTTTSLPTEPGARSQEIERWQAAGWIQRDTAIGLLELPDIAAESDLITADRDNLLWQLEQMLDEGIPTLPEPYQDLEKAILTVQDAVLRAKCEGCPEENLNHARAFVEACKELLTPSAPPVDPAAVAAAEGTIATAAGIPAAPTLAPVPNAAPVPTDMLTAPEAVLPAPV